MELCDVNILVNVLNASAPSHQLCRDWFGQALTSRVPLLLTSATLVAVVRVGTNPRAFPDPASLEGVLSFVNYLRALPQARVLEPGPDHWRLFTECCRAAVAKANLISDAHLAALALEHGARVVTMDRDFKRFPKLKVLHLKP